ncbi:hypothetical protein ACHQM5_019466 [Ranunculus cassubicifolius]
MIGPQQCTVIKLRRTMQKEESNWLDLPRDVVFLIFVKLGVLEVLHYAQYVCSLWRQVAKDPFLYQSLDFMDVRKHMVFQNKFNYIFKKAVDKSCGQLVRLSCGDMVHENLLRYVNLSNKNSLRCLHLGPALYLSERGLAAVMEGLPLLEEFELWFSYFPKLVVEQVGRCCVNLTTFRLCQAHNETNFDDDASVVSHNMPQLRYLGWIGGKLTNKGLQTLVDGCPHLEHLHLRHSSGRKVRKSMWKRCLSKTISLVLPEESSFGRDSVSEIVDEARVRKKYMKW